MGIGREQGCWNATSRVANSEWHELGLSHFQFLPIDSISVSTTTEAHIDYTLVLYPDLSDLIQMYIDSALPAYEDVEHVDSVLALVDCGCITHSQLSCI